MLWVVRHVLEHRVVVVQTISNMYEMLSSWGTLALVVAPYISLCDLTDSIREERHLLSSATLHKSALVGTSLVAQASHSVPKKHAPYGYPPV